MEVCSLYQSYRMSNMGTRDKKDTRDEKDPLGTKKMRDKEMHDTDKKDV